jgi:hypothetical protein
LQEVVEEIRRLMVKSAKEISSKEKLSRRRNPSTPVGKKQ